MKNIHFIVLLLFIFSCTKPCKDVDCGAHGACVEADGSCDCQLGWLKDNTGKCTVQDLCYNKNCGTNGTCNATTGDCNCVAGYQVNAAGKCDSVSRAKFISFYVVNAFCQSTSGTGTHSQQIIADPSGIDKVIIKNFGGVSTGTGDLNISATISGNTLNIPDQSITSSFSTYSVNQTSATLSGNSFTLPSKVFINGIIYRDCIYTYTK